MLALAGECTHDQRKVAAFDPPSFASRSRKAFNRASVSPSPSRVPGQQQADAPHPFRLLRARHQRPRRRAAEQRDELAAFHSITSSARASTVGGRFNAKCLRGLEVEYQLIFRGLLKGQITRFFAAQNTVNVAGGAAIEIEAIGDR